MSSAATWHRWTAALGPPGTVHSSRSRRRPLPTRSRRRTGSTPRNEHVMTVTSLVPRYCRAHSHDFTTVLRTSFSFSSATTIGTRICIVFLHRPRYLSNSLLDPDSRSPHSSRTLSVGWHQCCMYLYPWHPPLNRLYFTNCSTSTEPSRFPLHAATALGRS